MNKQNQLFFASCIALITTSMTFGIRADLVENTFGTIFSLSNEEIGWCIGTAFWGFTLAMIIGGPLVDVLGMKRILTFAFIGHLSGIILTIFATGFWTLFLSTLLIGIANGFVEAACNPLIATLFPNNKTTMLNRFHVWFPGGIVLGGLIAFLLTSMGIGWQIKMLVILIPNIIYGVMFFNKEFPKTERVTSGISTKEMFKACLNPLFIFIAFCMLLTASTELGTNQWISALLSNVGIPSILLLVFINGIMAMGRMFAGPIVHRFNPSGMLLFSAVVSCLGLFWLSYATGYITFLAAAVFAVGVTYFWPTMLGYVAEYTPNTGALGLAIIGGLGMLSVSIVLPSMGKVFDEQLLNAIPEGLNIDTLKSAINGSPEFQILENAKLLAGSGTLRIVSILPAFLIIAFTGLRLYTNRISKI